MNAAAALIPKFSERLTRIFASHRDKHEAHERARPVLEDICREPGFITEAIRRHLSAPRALDRGHYPVISFDLGLNAFFALVVNAWVSLPDGRTDLSTKAIHHHGDMLLSTAALFGPGYEHWTFSTPEPAAGPGGPLRMRLLGRPVHAKGQVCFVDHHIPHCPFYPPGLSLTLALWSSRRPMTWRDRLKRLPPFRGREQFFRGLAGSLGLGSALELKVVRDFDFFPTPQGFRSIPERGEFALGPNADYLRNIFHVIQGTGNEALLPQLRELSDRGWVEDRLTFDGLLADLASGRAIPGKLSEFHISVPKSNFTRKDVEASLDACR